MFLWFIGSALVVVWYVLHDTAIDYRVLVAGAVLPDLIDAPFGGARFAHTVLASATLLVAVMLATRGRRQARRRWLALPIGTLLHLAVDGVWGEATTFWWPFLGGSLDSPLPSLDRGPALLLLQEAAGAAAIVWFVRRFRLTDPVVRNGFLRTGRLPRNSVA